MAIRNRQSYKKYEEISPISQVSLVCKYKKDPNSKSCTLVYLQNYYKSNDDLYHSII